MHCRLQRFTYRATQQHFRTFSVSLVYFRQHVDTFHFMHLVSRWRLHDKSWMLSSEYRAENVRGREVKNRTTSFYCFQRQSVPNVRTTKEELACLLNRVHLHRTHAALFLMDHSYYIWTRGSVVTEGPRDTLCQLKSCQLLRNFTKNPT